MGPKRKRGRPPGPSATDTYSLLEREYRSNIKASKRVRRLLDKIVRRIESQLAGSDPLPSDIDTVVSMFQTLNKIIEGQARTLKPSKTDPGPIPDIDI